MNRSEAPAFSLADKFHLVFPQEISLTADIKLYWLKDVKDDSVKLDIEWFAGTKYQQKKLAASFANRLMLSGTAAKTARQISEEIDFYGGFIQDEVDKDHGAITLYGLRENFNQIFELFSDAMLNCSFPQKEFDDEKNIALSKFKIDSEKVKFLCQRKFNAALFGDSNPYGQSAEASDFDALTRDDLVNFYADYYLGTAPVLFLVGNVDDTVIEQIRKWASSLKPVRREFKAQPISQTKGRIDLSKADAIQSAIRVGRIAMDKKHPDYFGFQVLDTLIGGYFGSRLMNNIREDKGYTYGIGSAVAVMDHAAYFFIATEVAKEVKEATLTEIYFELDRLKTELVPQDELERVKNYLLGEFLRQADGPSAMMESFKNIWFNQLSHDYYDQFIRAIHATTAEEIQRLAVKYFVREEMTEVVAG